MIRYLAIGFSLTCLSSAGGVGLAVAHRMATEPQTYAVANLNPEFQTVRFDADPQFGADTPGAPIPQVNAVVTLSQPVATTTGVANLHERLGQPVPAVAKVRPVARPANLAVTPDRVALVAPLSDLTVSSQTRPVSVSAPMASAPADTRKITSPRYLIGVFR